MSAAEQLWIYPIRFKNILFAMDFSPHSLLAFPFAASIATRFGGKIFLAHVVSARDYSSIPPGSQAVLTKMQAEMEEALTSPFGALHDIPHELLLDQGTVSSSLLGEVEKRKIDLIVIGTHGWRGLKKFLKGSTAEEISSLSTRPVLTVGPNASRTSDFKRILYATDFSVPAAQAMPFALSIADAYHASLLFLHVNDWNSKELPVDAQPKTFAFVREQLCKFGYGKEMEKRSEVLVEFGPPTDLILEAATNREADLIVMGLHSRTGIKNRIAARLPGATSYDVISQSPCPVLTVGFVNTDTH